MKRPVRVALTGVGRGRPLTEARAEDSKGKEASLSGQGAQTLQRGSSGDTFIYSRGPEGSSQTHKPVWKCPTTVQNVIHRP